MPPKATTNIPPEPVGKPVGTPIGEPVTTVPTLDAKTPLLLLPVNIETRFMAVSERESELWVRIYPDQIAIDAHEPGLTQQEIDDGTSYWTQVWSAGAAPAPAGSPSPGEAPWRGLASIYGPQRAAWIALQMTPTNPGQQPAAAAQPGAAPTPAPTFPNPPMRAGTWTQAATADALPDAWTVVLISGAQTISRTGSPISTPLAMSITPLDAGQPAGTSPFPAGSPVDAGLQWLVDFDAALAAGMALKIALNDEQRGRGFDRIFVYGLRTAATGGSADLGALLDAHHYTDGFALVPQGAPTKNTQDASSAYSRKDPDFSASFAVECEAPLTQAPGCDGNLFASLLGIDPSHLAHVADADGVNEQSGRAMLTALWPATLGYFLSQMMDAVFTAEQIESARDYVIANTIPRGPAPAFRVGTTPYGVLPVTSLSRYKPARPEPHDVTIEKGLVNFVKRLWPAWLSSSASAPHMENTGDPDAELIGLLGMDASSMNFRGRQAFGTDFWWNLMTFLGVPPAAMGAWLNDDEETGRQLLNTYQYNAWDPRVIQLALSSKSFPVPLSTVQAGTLSETAPLTADADLGGGTKGNYIQWLMQASVAELKAGSYPGAAPNAMLFSILRQSLVIDYADLAASGEVAAGRLVASQFREAELIGIPGATPAVQPPVGKWELLERASVPDPSKTWAEYLVGFNPPPNSPYARLNEMRASLEQLAALPTAELDRLLTETLDACSHRLDVWAGAIANALLNRTRATNTGLHLGAFGWVEEVRPAPQQPQVQGTELAAVQKLDALRAIRAPQAPAQSVPVQPLTDNGGFIYAPSPEQAAAGAVLRNGYMTHKGTSEEALLAMDLSSDRVRDALNLMHGVQQGQSLNALLGYLFETGLADLSLQKYTQPFRDRFPVVGTKLTPSSAPSEAVAASNVVDGLALRTAWDAGQLAAGQNWGTGLPAPGADQTAVIGLLKTIDDYSAALSEVSMAEAVFQIIRGNFGRGGGLMNAISKGDRPPDPDVINTPRGGLDLTHRVAVLIAGQPAINPAWSGIPANARAVAEPWLEAWITSLLPDPATVVCAVQIALAGGATSTVNVRLLDLSVGALDCLAMADAAATPQQGELEGRILYAAAIPAGATAATINYQPAGMTAAQVSFPDFFFLAKALRSLVNSARALTPQDMTVPENTIAGGTLLVSGDLTGRAGTALSSLQAAIHTLSTAATAQSAAVAALGVAQTPANTAALATADAQLRAALLACSYYGVTGAIPSTLTDANLGAQAVSVGANLTARVTQATAPGIDSLGILSAIFGEGFIVLPQFIPPDAANLVLAFDQSAALVASDPVAPARWLAQLTHVRPAIARLDMALSLAQALAGPALPPPAPLLGQLPYLSGDQWLALPIDPANPPAKGRVALACFTQGAPSAGTYAGLMVDEWPERIPSTAEVATVAFHYEEPKARAPQACLLAVCPDDRPTWDADLVTGILEETLELAKIRTVDLSSLQGMGQILPALYFTLNLQEATVSLNFAEEHPRVTTPIHI